MIPDSCRIETERLILRPLLADDVSEAYLGWFTGSAARHIQSAPRSLQDLRDFAAEKAASPVALLLGMFAKPDGRHIGNLKFEPIDLSQRVSVLGIFVGAPDWQGRGAGPEAIRAGVTWLRESLGVSRVVLGVSEDNPAAIRAYLKVGFQPSTSPLVPERPGVCTFVLDMPGA